MKYSLIIFSLIFWSFSFTQTKGSIKHDNLVYGHNCGRIGIDPPERTLMKTAVDNKNKSFLIFWLKSEHLEFNLYALEGLESFERTDLSQTDLELIQQVKKKKGSVQVCSGCEYTRREFQEYSKKFFKDLEE